MMMRKSESGKKARRRVTREEIAAEILKLKLNWRIREYCMCVGKEIFLKKGFDGIEITITEIHACILYILI